MIKRIVGTSVEYYWEPEKYLNGSYPGEFLDRIAETGTLPFLSDQIYFHSDMRDFSNLIHLNIRKDQLRFPFFNTPLPFRVIMKKYIVMCILQENKKLQSIRHHFLELNKFFRFINENSIDDIEDVTPPSLQSYLNESKSYPNRIGGQK